MPDESSATGGWRRIAMIVLVVLGVVAAILIFLVLTGIIAEPETVIEQIVRAITGG